MLVVEPALELTACAKKIPHKTFMWFLEIAISVLAVRDLGIPILLQHFYWGIWTISRRAHFGGGGAA